MPPQRRPPAERALHPIRPNVGIRATYRKRLAAMVERMTAEVLREVRLQYADRPPPTLAEDAGPIPSLAALIRRLRTKWQRDIADLAPRLATWHATAIDKRSQSGLKKMLRDGGITVKMQSTPSINATMQATVGENVALIKSIPSAYFDQIEGAVMRAAAQGFDLHTLTKTILGLGHSSNARAALIARDQTNKATAVFNRERQMALGFKRGRWRHSHGGHEPRADHVAADGTEFDLDKGLYLSDLGRPPRATYRWQLPGTAINCRCVWTPIIENA